LKNKTRLTQLLLIIAGVAVIAIIKIAPRHNKSDRKTLANEEALLEVTHLHDHSHDHDHDAEADKEFSEVPSPTVDSALSSQFALLEDKVSHSDNDEEIALLYDSLVDLSVRSKLPAYAARYGKRKAMVLPTEKNWMRSGDIYFKAFQMSKKQSKSMINGAVAAYQKVLEINPENLEAKTGLGVAYVEGASILGMMPMKGIGVLQEVLNSDPENINAITNLGYFAIQSGQYEKAIERFETVLEIDPENAEAYIYLTDVYLTMGEKEKGIETLQKFKVIMNDPRVDRQVEDYIKEIKGNNNI